MGCQTLCPSVRTGNGLICEHRGQAECGWRFVPTVHIAARSMEPSGRSDAEISVQALKKGASRLNTNNLRCIHGASYRSLGAARPAQGHPRRHAVQARRSGRHRRRDGERSELDVVRGEGPQARPLDHLAANKTRKFRETQREPRKCRNPPKFREIFFAPGTHSYHPKKNSRNSGPHQAATRRLAKLGTLRVHSLRSSSIARGTF